MSKTWTADGVLQVSRSYQSACVLAAAADLNLFSDLAGGPLTAPEIARSLSTDPRATAILLDALAALELLEKAGDRYSLPRDLVPLLARKESGSVLAMARHQANCLRRWARLTQVVRTGTPPGREAGPDGPKADTESFIGAMHDVSAPVAREVIRALEPLAFRRLLDVGGASGTWTAAFLAARPEATAVLFDLPEVIPLARSRLSNLLQGDRVRLVPGDYLRDPLPEGADLAWISAVIHQNSREQNRALYASVFRALVPGGSIALRDIVMEPRRTAPVAGALFAVNMLVSTERGGTYTLDEIRGDLEASGFSEVTLARSDPGMNSLVVAKKTGRQG
jgi:SAM-dependent methyltransferase